MGAGRNIRNFSKWVPVWRARRATITPGLCHILTPSHGLTYGRFIDGLGKAGVEVDRKVLADLAIKDAAGFKALVDQAAAKLSAA